MKFRQLVQERKKKNPAFFIELKMETLLSTKIHSGLHNLLWSLDIMKWTQPYIYQKHIGLFSKVVASVKSAAKLCLAILVKLSHSKGKNKYTDNQEMCHAEVHSKYSISYSAHPFP